MPRMRAMLHLGAVAAVVAALVVAAAPAAARAASAAPRESAPPEPVLLDPGAEPRVLLRFDLEAGRSQDFTTTSRGTQRMTVDGEAGPWEQVESTTLGTRTVTAVDADGIYHIETLSSQEAPRPLVSGAPGVATRAWRMNDRGQVWEAGTAGSPDGPSSLVLPQEPVGVGGVWRLADTRGWPPGGDAVFESQEVTTVTLVGIDADGRYELEGEVSMSASDQEVPVETLPAGYSARFDEVELGATYHWLVDPRDPVFPVRATIDGRTTVTVAIDGEGQTMTRESRFEVELRIDDDSE